MFIRFLIIGTSATTGFYSRTEERKEGATGMLP